MKQLLLTNGEPTNPAEQDAINSIERAIKQGQDDEKIIKAIEQYQRLYLNISALQYVLEFSIKHDKPNTLSSHLDWIEEFGIQIETITTQQVLELPIKHNKPQALSRYFATTQEIGFNATITLQQVLEFAIKHDKLKTLSEIIDSDQELNASTITTQQVFELAIQHNKPQALFDYLNILQQYGLNTTITTQQVLEFAIKHNKPEAFFSIINSSDNNLTANHLSLKMVIKNMENTADNIESAWKISQQIDHIRKDPKLKKYAIRKHAFVFAGIGISATAGITAASLLATSTTLKAAIAFVATVVSAMPPVALTMAAIALVAIITTLAIKTYNKSYDKYAKQKLGKLVANKGHHSPN